MPAADIEAISFQTPSLHPLPVPVLAVCRIGGDEFAVVMLNTDAKAAAALADRLGKHLNATQVTLSDGITRLVTAAIGVSSAERGEHVEQWVARADQRLYEAKRSRSA